jgi:hypothetical protein
LPDEQAIHGGEGSPKSKKALTRRWMSRLVGLFVFVFVEHTEFLNTIKHKELPPTKDK